MATMEWDDNQTQLWDVDANELIVWGGHFSIKQSQLGTSIICITTVSSPFPFRHPS